MANTSDRPITVDGVRLDTLAWNVEKVTRATAARRSANVQVPGVDGVIPSLNDPLEPALFGLDMWLRGTDLDGVTPAGGSRTTFRQNLDELLHLFGKRHALLEVREQVDGIGTERRTLAKVVDTIAPDVSEHGGTGRFSVSLELPYGVWEDVAASDWNSGQVASGTAVEVTTLQGATERVADAVVLVTGPVTNPRVTDPVSGAWVQLNQALTGTQFWRVNMATWSSRFGTGLTFGSADTTGTDGAGSTQFGGTRNQAVFLPLTPARDTGARRVKVALSGTGITTATRIGVRARRKYAA